MTNGDRFRESTNEEIANAILNLRAIAIYAEGRLLCFSDSPEELELWMNKESDSIDDYIFKPYEKGSSLTKI